MPGNHPIQTSGRAVHKRPQEDAIHAGPVPYLQREVHFHNSAAHNQLAGTLSEPKGEGLFPSLC
jgi:hypothetical protein